MRSILPCLFSAAIAASTPCMAHSSSELSLDAWVAEQNNNASETNRLALAFDDSTGDSDEGQNVAVEVSNDHGMYFRFSAGANLAQDADFNNVVLIGPPLEAGLRDFSVSFDTGLDLNLALGFPIGDSWSIEASVGVATNEVSGVSANYYDAFLAPPSTNVASISGGSGDLLQVPIMVNARYGIDVSDSLEIGLSAGLGAQYSDLDLRDMTLTLLPAGPSSPLGITASGDGWSARGQLGVDLDWAIAENWSLGLYARYSATTETDFGASTKVESFQNVAIGGFVSFAF